MVVKKEGKKKKKIEIDTRTKGEKIADSNRARSKDLTLREKKLVAGYAKTGNKRQSAIKAGFSKKSADAIANETLKKPKVQAALKSAIDKLGINPEYVLGTIKNTIERCNQSAPVLDKKGEQVYCTNNEGDLVPAYRFDAVNVLKGAELLGKHLKLFTDEIEIKAEVKTEDQELTDAVRQILFLATQS